MTTSLDNLDIAESVASVDGDGVPNKMTPKEKIKKID